MPDDAFGICIVGLGLMGGSLALALRPNVQRSNIPTFNVSRIIGVSRSVETLHTGAGLGALDAGTTDLAEGVANADVIVLATPVRTILRLLPEVGRHARPGALVMDMGSSKAQIYTAIGRSARWAPASWPHTRCAARRSQGSRPPRLVSIEIARSCSARWNARCLRRWQRLGRWRWRSADVPSWSIRMLTTSGCRHQPPALRGRRDAGADGGHVG